METWASTLHAAVVASDAGAEPRILFTPAGDRWSLPRIVLPERIWIPRCEAILRMARDQLGLAAVVLRAVTGSANEPGRQIDAVYLLEPTDRAWTPPPAARWVGRDELAGLPLVFPAQRDPLDRLLRELATFAQTPSERPWTRPGWYATAAEWIADRLDGAGLTATGPHEQLSNWAISTVFRVPTSSGRYFFKAIPTSSGALSAGGILFANEPALLGALASRFPGQVPSPLAIDRERRWMLVPDVGQPLFETSDLDPWLAAVRNFARLQVASATAIDDLLASGCLDRRLETLPAQIEPLLADPLSADAIGAADLERLRMLTPRLHAAIEALGTVGLPATLVHGDLHAGNVGVRDGRVSFFDWTDACIAHPFVDARILPANGAEVTSDPEVKDRLVAAYLEEWTAFAPLDRLREAYALAAPVVALHNAVSYRRIVANADPVSNLALGGGLTWALRDLLSRLDEWVGSPL